MKKKKPVKYKVAAPPARLLKAKEAAPVAKAAAAVAAPVAKAAPVAAKKVGRPAQEARTVTLSAAASAPKIAQAKVPVAPLKPKPSPTNPAPVDPAPVRLAPEAVIPQPPKVVPKALIPQSPKTMPKAVVPQPPKIMPKVENAKPVAAESAKSMPIETPPKRVTQPVNAVPVKAAPIKTMPIETPAQPPKRVAQPVVGTVPPAQTVNPGKPVAGKPVVVTEPRKPVVGKPVGVVEPGKPVVVTEPGRPVVGKPVVGKPVVVTEPGRPVIGKPEPVREPSPVEYGDVTVEVLRPEDLVSFYLNFVNLKLDTSKVRAPQLVVDDAKNPAYLVVWFAPQAILEEAYFETATITSNTTFNPPVPVVVPTPPYAPAAPGSVPAYLAGRSRLVFEVPKAVKAIPYTIDGLLDWSKLTLTVSPVALGTPLPAPLTAPTFLETAIEIPWRIVLSPAKGVGWAHSAEPETFAGRTALWTTRLGKLKTVKAGGKSTEVVEEAALHNTIPLRAIWSQDFIDHAPLPQLDKEIPFRASLDPHDRTQIVILTSGTLGYSVPGTVGPGTEWTPEPIQASRLFLSALGGFLDSRGQWPNPPFYTYTDPTTGQAGTQELDLIEWDHQATMGRDHYVRVVYAGYLYPFGHAASLIKVTERKITSPDVGGNVTQTTAYLRQRMYIVVREPEKSYAAETAQYTHQAREFPFWNLVKIKTKVTPDIDIPEMLTNTPGMPAGHTHNSFWVEVANDYFQFHVEATGLDGTTTDFLAPLVFMSLSEDFPADIQTIYAAAGSPRTCTVNGRKIAYADPSAGDTILRTTALNFTTQLILQQPPYPVAPFLPTLDNAMVTVPAVEQILGTATPVEIELYAGYLANKLDANAGVYAVIAVNPPTISFNAGQAGGFATPVLVMSALSARKGLVAGSPDDAANGNMKPSAFFDLSAQLFGSVPLQKLIPVDENDFAPAAQNAPEIRTSLKPNSKAPTQSVTRLNWSPQLQGFPNPTGSNQDAVVGVTMDQNNANSALTLKTEITRNLAGGPPASQVTGQLTNFQFSFADVIAITFNSIKFSSANGQKLVVKADLPSTGAIAFIGAMSWVQTLAEVLPPGIFGKGPSVDLEPSQIVVSYTIGLPPISIGVLSIENIAITTGLSLPYLSGEPGFDFAFSSRSKPFLITVECLGGGGFIHLLVTASGVQMVEGSLEFGGEFSIDLGVASGSVHAMAGIYFKLTGTSSDITGFVDIGGEVSVLGIISVSIDLNLSLSYQTSNGKSMVQGRATLTIGVHVLFFSVSVSVSVERSFGSDAGDPRVDQMITGQDWADYAAAYAA